MSLITGAIFTPQAAFISQYKLFLLPFRAISSENKGHKLLAKMGWKEGDSLGKTAQSGITEPVSKQLKCLNICAEIVHLILMIA